MRCWIQGGALNALRVSATHSYFKLGIRAALWFGLGRDSNRMNGNLLHQFGTGGSSLDQQRNTSSLWSFLWRYSRVHCVLWRFGQSDDKSLSWEAIFKLFAIEKGMNWHKWSTIILVDFSNSSQMISMCFVNERGERVDCLDGGRTEGEWRGVGYSWLNIN